MIVLMIFDEICEHHTLGNLHSLFYLHQVRTNGANVLEPSPLPWDAPDPAPSHSFRCLPKPTQVSAPCPS